MYKSDFFNTKKRNLCVPFMLRSKEAFDNIDLADANLKLADIIELRVDSILSDSVEDIIELARYAYNKIKENLENILVIITYRTKAEGGEGGISSYDYKELLSRIAKEISPDFVDVEINRGELLFNDVANACHKNEVAVIGSYHNFVRTPGAFELIDIIAKMDRLGADVLKVAAMPECNHDVVKIFNVTNKMRVKTNKPIISMSMGERGRVSRIYGYLAGSVVTFVTLNEASAPGQLPIGELKAFYDNFDKKNKISLIGFMGSGKSLVSRKLHNIFNYECIDTDSYIEEKEGMTINKIFELNGEEYFRNCEHEMLKEIESNEDAGESDDCNNGVSVYSSGAVISCGGGIIKRDDNIEILKKISKVVLLDITPGLAYKRLKDTTNRPLLKDKMNVSDISKLIEERKPLYDKAMDICVLVDDKDPEEIAVEIMNKVYELSK